MSCNRLQLFRSHATQLLTAVINRKEITMARKTAAQTAAEQIKDQAFSELAALIEESDKLLKDSAALVGEDAETVRAQLSVKLKQALDSLGSVREKTKPAVEATETYIGGHPWQTVAVSAGFGLVVGLLLGRK
jgi:ElaB/YqjD/DUF883 family membrane-anchored ribosome-binding protein